MLPETALHHAMKVLREALETYQARDNGHISPREAGHAEHIVRQQISIMTQEVVRAQEYIAQYGQDPRVDTLSSLCAEALVVRDAAQAAL